MVLDSRPDPGQEIQYTTGQVCANKTGAVSSGATESFSCVKTGRYLAVVKSRTSILTLCEVEVFGTGENNTEFSAVHYNK